VPKQTFKIESFHGGLNSNSDPRDIRENESPSLKDVAIDSVGKIKTLGSTVASTADSNTISILKNRGLFTMSSDRQLDGHSANETLIFLHDNVNHTIDVNDSEGWDTALINMGGSSIPIYYTADGVIRVSDASLTQNSQWFGYIEDQKFASLNATGATAEWVNVSQSLTSPTSGKCLISTPAVGSDVNGVNSSVSEYFGTVANDTATQGDVLDVSAVNLRVGIQHDNLLPNLAANVSGNNANDADNTDHYPFIGNNNIYLDSNSNATFSDVDDASIEYTINDSQSFVIAFYITSGTEYNRTDFVSITCGTGLSGSHTTGFRWTVPQSDIVPDCWNVIVCSANTHDTKVGTDEIDFGGDFTHWQLKLKQNSTGTSSNASPSFYCSGPVIAPAISNIQGFQPGTYTFHYTHLYDVENKQESLPFKFSDVDNDDTTKDVNKIVIHKNACLFNFDAYICSNNAAGDAYGLNKRISGSRLYYKKEENDNYFLIGELDFVEKGFKFLPEADTISYSMSNTTSQTTPILSKTALIKGISPETANTIDTFKTINGFSTEVKSLDAKYKTAVVHGRRVYIGNIKRPDNKTYPDRIVKSQVNRFDTFPEGMGAVDVVIRDGESIVKLEAYADRILQFKQHSLYIINVSESVDFLEDTFRNKGCAFDYHVVRTDLGIAWFNDHGCYLYDGKSIIHLLEKNNIRLVSEEDWSLFVKDGTDDPDMSSAMIGYVPKKKHLIIKNENNDIYLYDFVLQAWTIGIGKISESTAMTNFALDGDQDLFYIDNTTTVRNTWQSSPQSSTGFEYITSDIDFGEPGVGKKVYKVIITYKSGATTNVQVDYDVNGGTTFPYDFADNALKNFTSNELASASGWQVAELIPDNANESNNIKSFQLRFATDGTVPSGFEINDITIIYRLKNVK